MGCRERTCNCATMDSSSLGASCGSNDSLNGLKFGKKIYFEDGATAGGSSSTKLPPSPATATATAPSAPSVKKGKGVAQGGGRQQLPPRCQVEGCREDLTGTKAYYCRHKVCRKHSKEAKVIVGGLEQRFCQQCSRFHQLQEFDQGKRSCRRRLAGHNERRRKPPPGPSAARYGRIASSFHEEPSRFRSFLMDFSYPRVPSTARDAWPTIRAAERVSSNQWQGILEPPSSAAAGVHPYFQGPPEVALFSAPPAECLAGASDSSCALSLLSTHPWNNHSTGNRTPTDSASSCFEGTSVAHSVVSNNCTCNSWGLRGHGGRANSHEVHHEMGLVGMPEAGHAHFSGELELALQGNAQCLHNDSSRQYGHSGPGVHWSL